MSVVTDETGQPCLGHARFAHSIDPNVSVSLRCFRRAFGEAVTITAGDHNNS